MAFSLVAYVLLLAICWITMNTTSVAFLELDSSEEVQSRQLSTATSKTISRAVFDDLLERDLLGFLLSSVHLRMYFAHFSQYAEPEIAQLIMRHICNVDVVDKIHENILEMFSCTFIPESRISKKKELLGVLDEKFEEYKQDLAPCGVQYGASSHQVQSVEMAWKYRSACIAGSDTLFL